MDDARDSTPADNAALVRRFIAAWDRLDADELAEYFAEDGVFQNMPRGRVEGRDAIRQHLKHVLAGHDRMHFDVETVVASGDNVVLERVDHLWAGEVAVSLPVVGVFTLSHGNVMAWRDYFDPTPLEPLVEALAQRQAWPA